MNNENKYVVLLRKRIKNIKQISLDVNSVVYWSDMRLILRKNILEEDITDFCNWSMGMFYRYNPQDPLVYIQNDSDEWSLWKEAMKKLSVGNPVEAVLSPGYEENTIHQARHFASLKEITQCDFKKLEEVVEFGGGYGCACRLLFRLGFKGRYIIYDLPEFIALQEYYLSQIDVMPKPKIFYNEVTEESNCIVLFDNLDLLKQQRVHDSYKQDLFLAAWSISEVSIDQRDKVFDVLGSFKYYLIAFAEKWKGGGASILANIMDNEEYFKLFCLRRYNYLWNFKPIVHLNGVHFYLVGSYQDGSLGDHEQRRKKNEAQLNKMENEHKLLLKAKKMSAKDYIDEMELRAQARAVRKEEVKNRIRVQRALAEKRKKLKEIELAKQNEKNKKIEIVKEKISKKKKQS